MASVTKPMALDETLQATNAALAQIKTVIESSGGSGGVTNITYGTEALAPGSSALPSGQVYLQYV